MAVPRISALQHFAFEVADTDRSIEFYRTILGFKLTERHPAHEVAKIPVELTFMRLDDRHHQIVIVNNPAKTYRPRPVHAKDDLDGPPSFHHIAYECETRQQWLDLLDHARANDVEVVRGPVLHSFVNPRGDGSWGENEAFYMLDPDGHRIEIFYGLATIDTDGTHISPDGERLEGTSTAEL
jgi:catechol 2,3-dioxygenase-like lactoylglutathione lyase family enzyme